MKSIVDIASELRGRLREFGSCDLSRRVIERATLENGWFSPPEIVRSVEAIADSMLERSALNKWLECYPSLPHSTPRRVAIIMAGNIPLVGLFDLLCTLAAGCEAWVKPSSKDRVLMEYICSLLKEIEPAIPIYKYEAGAQYHAIIATGGSEANRYFEQQFAHVKHLCRSNRHSIAVLSGSESESQMRGLSEDIYSYSGLGCRNVAMIFAPQGSRVEIPPLATGQKYRNNYLQTKALLSMSGSSFVDNGSSLMVYSHELPRSLSAISIYEYESIHEVEQWIEQHEEQLQCIVSGCIEHPRRVDFGAAQHPTLHDYADGVDTMAFLQEI